MSSSVLAPDGWLVLGLPWPMQTRGGFGECATALAPQLVPRHFVSQGAGEALDLASAFARTEEGPGKTVFFSDITLWLDGKGKTWADLGIDHQGVIEELLSAPVPQLYLTMTQLAHGIVCDASREGLRAHYDDGRVEHITRQTRQDVHDALTATLERDWPPYIRELMDRGAIRAQCPS